MACPRKTNGICPFLALTGKSKATSSPMYNIYTKYFNVTYAIARCCRSTTPPTSK